MPRWKTLPDELDPQIKEFTSRLRRLVDHSGLSIAALADRTGYSKTSWERYLGGRLLAPKGAVVALAEVTGTSPVHLTTLWELAERAWSRAEMRHDPTMEQARISEARAALGEFGAAEAGARGGAATARRGTGTAAAPGVAGPAGVAPPIPPQPTPSDADAREYADARRYADARQDTDGQQDTGGRQGGDARQGTDGRRDTDGPHGADGRQGGEGQLGVDGRQGGEGPQGGDGRQDGEKPQGGDGDSGTEVNSWRLAGYQGPSPTSGRPGGSAAARPRPAPDGPGRPPGTPNPYGGQPQAPQPAVGANHPGGTGGKRRLTMFLAGVVGVLVVVAAVFLLTRPDGGGKDANAAKSPSPSASGDATPPPGVKCSGSSCTGKDAESMGCSGDLVTTAKTAALGTVTLEVRYSRTCGAAWGRITGAGTGDRVRVIAGKARQSGDITEVGDTIAYTPMVAVKDAAEAKACATLASGRTGCTK
ncbi:helix-turn-helix domain-containing protein [Streptomyces collinus]|uniref:helix-turn-helix domain-containing protein n=1 Tax=Streptomyces collinus TaxID=42684 RepID=UPI0036407DCC